MSRVRVPCRVMLINGHHQKFHHRGSSCVLCVCLSHRESNPFSLRCAAVFFRDEGVESNIINWFVSPRTVSMCVYVCVCDRLPRTDYVRTPRTLHVYTQEKERKKPPSCTIQWRFLISILQPSNKKHSPPAESNIFINQCAVFFFTTHTKKPPNHIPCAHIIRGCVSVASSSSQRRSAPASLWANICPNVMSGFFYH